MTDKTPDEWARAYAEAYPDRVAEYVAVASALQSRARRLKEYDAALPMLAKAAKVLEQYDAALVAVANSDSHALAVEIARQALDHAGE